MKKTMILMRPAIICFFVMTILCGVIYTAAVTGISKLLFPSQAEGSIITITFKDGTKKDYGSSLIAQEFTSPRYLIGRPQVTTNLSPVSEEQKKLVQERVSLLHSFDPENKEDIPMDLVTASGSGADPNITPEAAEYQVKRIAKVRGINEDEVRSIISEYTTSRFFGFWGESGVNVLKVNLALDGLW